MLEQVTINIGESDDTKENNAESIQENSENQYDQIIEIAK